MAKIEISGFISYAHKDARYFKIFKDVLIGCLNTSSNFQYNIWDDSEIPEGSNWNDEIQKKLGNATIAILCISRNFLNSPYIKTHEFHNLITSYPNTKIIPVFFSPCKFDSWDELAKKQFFMPLGKEYNKPEIEKFSFCDLVEFDKNSIPFQSPNIERYMMDLMEKIEKQLQPDKKIEEVVINPIIDGENTNKIKFPPGTDQLLTTKNILTLMILIVMLVCAIGIIDTLIIKDWNTANMGKSGVCGFLFFGSGALINYNRK